MITYLPYESFEKSAAALSHYHLSRQRIDTLQIMIALINKKGKVNSPIVKMWQGYEFGLLHYQQAICEEWHVKRGHDDGILKMTTEIFWDAPWLATEEVAIPPFWLGEFDIHLSHQSDLIRQNPKRYRKIFGDVPDDLPLVYPSRLA